MQVAAGFVPGCIVSARALKRAALAGAPRATPARSRRPPSPDAMSDSDSDSDASVAPLEAVEVFYCGVSGLPPEYIEWLGKDEVERCKPWLKANYPRVYELWPEWEVRPAHAHQPTRAWPPCDRPYLSLRVRSHALAGADARVRLTRARAYTRAHCALCRARALRSLDRGAAHARPKGEDGGSGDAGEGPSAQAAGAGGEGADAAADELAKLAIPAPVLETRPLPAPKRWWRIDRTRRIGWRDCVQTHRRDAAGRQSALCRLDRVA